MSFGELIPVEPFDLPTQFEREYEIIRGNTLIAIVYDKPTFTIDTWYYGLPHRVGKPRRFDTSDFFELVRRNPILNNYRLGPTGRAEHVLLVILEREGPEAFIVPRSTYQMLSTMPAGQMVTEIRKLTSDQAVSAESSKQFKLPDKAGLLVMSSRVQKTKRMLEERAEDLESSDGHTIENAVNSFLAFCESDVIMRSITQALTQNTNVNVTKWYDDFCKSRSFILPTNDDDEAALLYQLLLKIRSNEIKYYNLELGGGDINESAFRFNDSISRPLVRYLRHRIEEEETVPETSASSERMATVSIPTEIRESIARFREDHPDSSRVGFIMMKFKETPAHEEILKTIKDTLTNCGLVGVRSDDHEYHKDLFFNIQTYMHGCGFGIAIFDRIEEEEFSPNVSLEVGYMMALGKDVCLLKDKTLETLHADLLGKLYKPFDPQNAERTIPYQLSKWLSDKGLGQPPKRRERSTSDDEQFMRKAIEESRQSEDENDGKAHPKVGAVVVKDGKVLATAHRGEIGLGNHAEYTVLEKKLPSSDLSGTTIYTTLEPCTSRAHKTPCVERIIQRKIARVVIGVVDPNPTIMGGSVGKLKMAGIEVTFVTPTLEAEIKDLNKSFLEYQMKTASEEDSGPKIRLDESEPLMTIGKDNLTVGSMSNSRAKLLFMNRGSLTGTLVDVEGGIPPKSNNGKISFTLDRSRFPVQVEPYCTYAQEVNFHLDSNPKSTIGDIAKEFQGKFEITVPYKVSTKTGTKKLTGTAFVKFEL